MTTRRRNRAIYRRRRLAVFGGAIVLVAVLAGGVWLAVAQPWADAPAALNPTASPSPGDETAPPTDDATPSPDGSDEPSTEPSTEASAEPSAEPTAEETPGIASCQAKDVTVEASVGDSFAAGSFPEFEMVLTNKSSAECMIDVGTATQIFTVTSGTDVWWDSRHCQEEPSNMVVTLAAGQSVRTADPLVWDRTRSDAKTCDQENRPRAPGGGASYHLAVSIGGFSSATTQQFLLY